MASSVQRSPLSPSSPLNRLSTFSSPTVANTTTTTTTSPLATISDDPLLSSFLSPDFSPLSFSSAALSSGSPASTAEHLLSSIRLLDSQLRSEVLSRHSDLLSQLSSLKSAELSLSSVKSSLSSLLSSLRRIRSDLSDPYLSLSSLSFRLRNLHRTTELLQHTIRTLRLCKKLRDLVPEPADAEKIDLAKAAQLHSEILGFCKEYDLFGIDPIDEEIKFVKEIGDRIRSEAIRVLERGMEGLNQAEVGTGLQVFYNLGELRTTVESIVNKYKGIGVKSIGAALDMKAISGGGGYGPGGIRGSGTPQIGGGAKAREGIWKRMDSCMDQLHSVVVAVWHLQRVLSKKRDPFTHVLLLDEVIQVSGFGNQCWIVIGFFCVFFPFSNEGVLAFAKVYFFDMKLGCCVLVLVVFCQMWLD